MFLAPEGMGQFISLLLIALALGMDAFSLGLSIGIRGPLFRQISVISLTVGLFHLLMPLLGIGIGHVISDLMGAVAIHVGGGLLCVLGINMIWSGLSRESAHVLFNDYSSYWRIFVLAFTVSVDSFSTGLSLGIFSVHTALAVSMLGMGGGVMAGIGLAIGRFASRWLGDYGELFGGTVLLGLGLKFLI